jgi:hypothetical protein
MKHTPERPLISVITASLLCFDVTVLVGAPAEEEGADGVNVAPGLLKQELAAAFSADTEDGALGLAVALPAKLQLPEERFCAS